MITTQIQLSYMKVQSADNKKRLGQKGFRRSEKRTTDQDFWLVVRFFCYGKRKFHLVMSQPLFIVSIRFNILCFGDNVKLRRSEGCAMAFMDIASTFNCYCTYRMDKNHAICRSSPCPR